MKKYAVTPIKEKIIQKTKLVLCGCLTGFVCGFLGGGGGMILIPAMTYLLQISEKQSHATAIAVILPLSVISAVVYHINGVGGGDFFYPVTAGVIVGGALGAALLAKLSAKWISSIFYVIMIAVGIQMIIA